MFYSDLALMPGEPSEPRELREPGELRELGSARAGPTQIASRRALEGGPGEWPRGRDPRK